MNALVIWKPNDTKTYILREAPVDDRAFLNAVFKGGLRDSDEGFPLIEPKTEDPVLVIVVSGKYCIILCRAAKRIN